MPRGGARPGAGRPRVEGSDRERRRRRRAQAVLVCQFTSESEWADIVARLIKEAIGGSIEAIKLMLAYHDGLPIKRVEMTGAEGEPLDPVDTMVDRLAKRLEAEIDDDDDKPELIN